MEKSYAAKAPGLGKGLATYHTHTFRCRHAMGKDIDYVTKAIEGGFSVLGFSDHTPFKEPFKTKGNIRMLEGELGDYVSSINSLRDQFADKIDVHLGLEVEPFFQYFDWLQDMVRENGIEYLILGNHYAGQTEFDGYYGKVICDVPKMKYYVETSRKAIETGLFMYMAHPDLPFSNYPEFDANCESLSKDICSIAQEYRMPLEYNVSGYYKRIDGKIKGLGYPCEQFWDIAMDYDIDVFVGFDAHMPERMDRKLFDEAVDTLKKKGFRVVNA